MSMTETEKIKENIMWCIAATFVSASVYFTFVYTLLAEYVLYGSV